MTTDLYKNICEYRQVALSLHRHKTIKQKFGSNSTQILPLRYNRFILFSITNITIVYLAAKLFNRKVNKTNTKRKERTMKMETTNELQSRKQGYIDALKDVAAKYNNLVMQGSNFPEVDLMDWIQETYTKLTGDETDLFAEE